MTNPHKLAIGLAIIGAFALLAGMLFGSQQPLPDYIAIQRSVRDVAVALWAFLLPAWFMLEAVWFAPPPSEPDKLAQFQAGQTKARLTWVVIGGAIGIVIGLTAPPLTTAGNQGQLSSSEPAQKP